MKRQSTFLSIILLIILCAVTGSRAASITAGLRLEPGNLIWESADHLTITGGVQLTRMVQYTRAGWIEIHVLEVDLSRPGVYTDTLLGGGVLTSPQPVSEMADREGAVAAVNGDFFYSSTGSPVGLTVSSGQLAKGAYNGSQRASFVLTRDGSASIDKFRVTQRLVSGMGDVVELAGINDFSVPSNQAIAYTHMWGKPLALGGSGFPDSSPATENDDDYVVVIAPDGRIASRGPGSSYRGEYLVPEGAVAIIADGAAAEELIAFLSANPQGARYTIEWAIDPNGEDLWNAVTGYPLLVWDGRVSIEENPWFLRGRHPRTAVGLSKDKQTLYLVTVDGRSSHSIGMTLEELAAFMVSLGSYTALNLDGGGSTTMTARLPGDTHQSVLNRPSDGSQRPVPNGLGVFDAGVPGRLDTIRIFAKSAGRDPLNPGPDAPTGIRVPAGGSWSFEIVGFDRSGRPVKISRNEALWKVEPELGVFEKPGTFRANSPGLAKVQVSVPTYGSREGTPGIEATIDIQVTGTAARLRIEPERINASPGAQIQLRLTAIDENGFEAPVDPADIEWDVDEGIGTIDRNGVLHLGPHPKSGSVTATFSGISVRSIIEAANSYITLDSFEQRGNWKALGYPEEVRASFELLDPPLESPAKGMAGRLEYDFSSTGRTRAAYAEYAAGGLELPGRPRSIGLWVYGDGGRGHWLRAQISGSDGVKKPIDLADRVDWSGWKFVEASLPAGIAYPVTLHRIYLAEFDPGSKDSGEIYLDGLVAGYAGPEYAGLASELESGPVPGSVPVGITPSPPDPNNRNSEPFGRPGRTFSFGVFGDSKLESTAGGSVQGGSASQAANILTEIVGELNRAGVNFSIYMGDLVNYDSDANFDLGDSILGKLQSPLKMVAGNHELEGTGNLENFKRRYGQPNYSFTYYNSLFIVLNTSRGGITASDWTQWAWLRDRLETSRADNVFIFSHTPTYDPRYPGERGFADAREGMLLDRMLEEYALTTGKNVWLFGGHVHGFSSTRRGGITMINTGGAGADLHLAPGDGGFYHYLIVSVAGRDISYQVVPVLDSIRIEPAGPVNVRVGERIAFRATGYQDSKSIPLEYPVHAHWSTIDPAVGRWNQESNEFVAISPGATGLVVTSGKLSARVTINVTE